MVAAAQTHRLFFALWPSDRLRERIAEVTREPAGKSRGRLTQPNNFHITLAFVGEVPEDRLAAALQAGAETIAPPFELVLEQVELLRRSHVLCLTASQVPPELVTLEQALQAQLSAQQFRLRRQALRPHLTLVRDVPRWQPPVAVRPVRWPVQEFVLVGSQLARGGSVYSIRGRWPLAKAQPIQ
jgi:RNA 2',3'-cyclic 3'-phosphodiesterase